MKKEPGYLKLKIDAKTLRQVVSFCSWAKIPGQSLPPIRQKDLKTHYSIESIAAAVHWLPAFFASVRYSEMRKKENRRTMRKQLQRYREKIWMSGNIFFFMILCFFSWVSTSPQVRKINVNSFLNKKKRACKLDSFHGQIWRHNATAKFQFQGCAQHPKNRCSHFILSCQTKLIVDWIDKWFLSFAAPDQKNWKDLREMQQIAEKKDETLLCADESFCQSHEGFKCTLHVLYLRRSAMTLLEKNCLSVKQNAIYGAFKLTPVGTLSDQ